MATREEIELHYDTVGSLHALRLEKEHGGFPDYTCAFFDGDFSKSLKDAQENKHSWIFDGVGLGQDLKGKRVLDIGCGWGPILNAVRKRGGEAIGLTLSPGQVKHCKDYGLDARLKDYKDLKDGELGVFDAVVSLGAFEHFCSVEENLSGQQNQVYKDFFEICSKLLRPGGILFLQTMTWGKEVPNQSKLSLSAPKGSTEAILARMEYLYPGSWLPNGLDHLVANATGHFDFIDSNNGRLDYLETLKRWSQATKNLLKPNMLPRALNRAIPLAMNVLTNHDARIQWESIRRGDQSTCFRREIMSHERAFFRKKV